jgi:hypothetical protein
VRDPSDETQVNDKISRYLQHCTEQRVDGKEWKVGNVCRVGTFDDYVRESATRQESAVGSICYFAYARCWKRQLQHCYVLTEDYDLRESSG